MQERLNKYISTCGYCSRRKADELISAGVVKVNGTVVRDFSTKVNSEIDVVEVRGKTLELQSYRLFAYHKPAGLIVSMKQQSLNKPCVGSLLKEKFPFRLYPVGRLDSDVTGLLLFTNDGDFANAMLHPSKGIKRTYIAQVLSPVTKDKRASLLAGVDMRDGFGKADRVVVRKESPELCQLLNVDTTVKKERYYVELTVSEGRKHFVKRILARVGCRVAKLCRVSFGDYKLSDLRVGEFREESIKQF